MAYTKKTTTKRKAKPAKSKAMERVAKAVVRKEMARNSELKVKYNQGQELAVSTLTQGTNWYDLTAIDQGVGGEDRIGREVMLKGIDLRGHIHNNGANTNWVRIAVFKAYEQTDMSSLSTIFKRSTDAADFSLITGIRTIYYPFNNTELKCVYDKTIKLNPVATTGSNDESAMFRHFIKRNERIRFEANANEGQDVQRPRYWLAVWAAESAEDVGVGQTIELSYLARTFFSDS